MRVAILGNAGSGKSTLARSIAAATAAPVLDRDTLAWGPSATAVLRDPDAAAADVRASCARSDRWIVEDCCAILPTRLSWLAGYGSRRGALSWQGHRDCFDAYACPERELDALPEVAPLDAGLLAWLRGPLHAMPSARGPA